MQRMIKLILAAAVFAGSAPRGAAGAELADHFADHAATSLVCRHEPQPEKNANTTLRPVDGLADTLLVEGSLAGSEVATAEWAFRVQGVHDAGYARLEHRDDLWYESTYWQGDETWLRVGRNWHHPGDRGPSIRRFTAPRDGTIRISGTVRKAHLDGDGVRVEIRHNEQTVWQHALEGKDGQGVEPEVTLTVRSGDAIRFVVDKRGAIACDTTYWDPVITYQDGARFQASQAFADGRQDAAGWSYEMQAGAGPHGGPRLWWFDRHGLLSDKAIVAGEAVVIAVEDAWPCVVLADGEDRSGLAIVPGELSGWRLECSLAADGLLSLRLHAAIKQEPRRAVIGAYQGKSASGWRLIQSWLAAPAEKHLPLAGLRRSLASTDLVELDYWTMIQDDWRRQDQTEAALPETFASAAARHVEKAEALVARLQRVHGGGAFREQAEELERLRAAASKSDPKAFYVAARLLKRRIALANPLLDFKELLFCKRVPTSYSHLVMQYYGWRARPGGGLFVLEQPGKSLRARDILAGKLSTGNVLEPRLSYDGRRIVFSYVECPNGPLNPAQVANVDPADRQFYHVWEVNSDGTGLRQLTDGPYDDVMPCPLPDGGIAFMSTRRRGYARCFGPQFSPRWDVYTLHRMDGDGRNVRTLSFHDTNEWFPAVSNTGHILYARWDYIDRDAVTHQTLWASRPDGTSPMALWGNATAKPHCTFQPQPIPESNKIIFTASAHHSITGGPVAIVDPSVAADGETALERITPEIPFPEAESRDIREYYDSPWPLSEDFYLVGYSPYPLEWEPAANRPDALGIYLLDRWGNRELIYRDAAIGSSNPCPLRPRPAPPVLASHLADDAEPTGEVVLSDVYRGLGDIPRGRIKELRIVQIFPKTTPLADSPPVGMAREENGRAVLGTVPVEADGSARFLVPARKPLLFQALDADGFAWQTMRSVTYVQPGERVSCVGCHEPKMTAPPPTGSEPLALGRAPSAIDPGRWGGRPFSFPEVVQPLLDRHCVSCHGSEKAEGNVVLTSEPAGTFTRSYVALMEDANAFWGDGTNAANVEKYLVPRFGGRNQIQVTPPGGMYGALGSRLVKLLRAGHEDVELADDDWRRLAMWIDLNAIFYGVNLPDDQARILRGEPVDMPDVQ